MSSCWLKKVRVQVMKVGVLRWRPTVIYSPNICQTWNWPHVSMPKDVKFRWVIKNWYHQCNSAIKFWSYLSYGKVERREDVDATAKEQETFDMLVAAGYYRARIKGLSPFDKVVGGMTWCIECCDYDVDVDLLFHENLTIGQKMWVRWSQSILFENSKL